MMIETKATGIAACTSITRFNSIEHGRYFATTSITTGSTPNRKAIAAPVTFASNSPPGVLR